MIKLFEIHSNTEETSSISKEIKKGMYYKTDFKVVINEFKNTKASFRLHNFHNQKFYQCKTVQMYLFV